MDPLLVARLSDAELGEIRPLLVDLFMHEQPHYPGHPQWTRAQLERSFDDITPTFPGENVVFAARGEDGAIAGFCWVVLFDPGTGLEGEVAEVFVEESMRSRGLGLALVQAAVDLFRERGVTLGYVWTRDDNAAAERLYRAAGFGDNPQLVLTWYPRSDA